MKRPLVGSKVIRSNDKLERVAVVVNVTEEENVLRYDDGQQIHDRELPLIYVGLSDPATWAPSVKFPRVANRDEMDRMVKSIKKNGQLEPIAMHDGVMLDGRNRMLACNLAGVEPIFAEIATSDPVGWARAKNIDRRHLSMEDIKQAIKDEVDYIRPTIEAAKVRREANLRNSLAKSLESEDSSTVSNDTFEGRTRSSIAQQFGVGEATVARTFAELKVERHLRERDPVLFERVKAGEIKLKAALIETGLASKPAPLTGAIEKDICIWFAKRHLKAVSMLLKDNGIAWYKGDSNE